MSKTNKTSRIVYVGGLDCIGYVITGDERGLLVKDIPTDVPVEIAERLVAETDVIRFVVETDNTEVSTTEESPTLRGK